jgi:hypothetical protein
MTAWLLDTLAMYGRALGLGARLLAGNPMLAVPALACLVGPVLGVVVLAPLVAVFGTLGGVVAGVLGLLLESACWSALLACTGEVIRTQRLVLHDVRAGFLAYLGDVVNVRFVVWIITFFTAGLPGPVGIMITLAMLTFFNAVPELIYLGRYGTADLLAASYRFIGERWIEWFPMNALLLGLLVAAATLVVAPVVGAMGQVPSGLALGVGVVVTAVLLAFAMLVRGLLFLDLTQSSRRARAFRRAAGG